ncbi:CMRF35-like molecule 6 [Nothoprocta perdicaria]|uniref:CMRF35-like molecule 6 n=1 Tax=Nothoprocta perdicaria TaxID=30464 RepID=UPI000E1C3350|nr:CMRF35-like molecule 6 [Nothoprocta perdicaria]
MGTPWLLPALLLPGCWALTGPTSVHGFVGGTLSVSCKYEDGLETNEKFWCKPGNIYACAGPYIIATSERNSFVRKDRISIWDDRRQREFTVTMSNLTEVDTGTYLCGVWRPIRNDRHIVKVNVLPETESSSSADPPALTASTSVLTGASPQEKTAKKERPIQPPTGDPRAAHLDLVMDVLTPCIVVVLLLLVLAAGVLVKLSRKRKKALAAAPIEMHMERSASHTGTEGSLQYAELAHPAAAEDGRVYGNVRAAQSPAGTETGYTEIRPRQQSSQEEEGAACGTASALSPEQQDLYCNVQRAPRPAEPLYSTVLKPR